MSILLEGDLSIREIRNTISYGKFILNIKLHTIIFYLQSEKKSSSNTFISFLSPKYYMILYS
jgi:hypothetical protein